MSHYTYTDRLGWDLHVASGAEEILIQARDGEGNAIGITPRNEDAPAVALAILKASGRTLDDLIACAAREFFKEAR